MLHLMNSAMMPTPGLTYRLRQIDEKEARKIFHKHKRYGWKSYIGYPNTAKVASEVLGTEVLISREQTFVEPGDVMLILKLRYRVTAPGQKALGKLGTSPEEFEWLVCEVSEG